MDAYAPCPCGSGKKFKWCCQPIHAQIERAFTQDAEGQHDTALRLMDEVIAEHPANPEVLGRKAQLLFQNDRVEEAETALQKAFAINPNYPFGNLLRGLFRQHEGEVPGALLLFRRAAELYDPEAREVLGQIYALIADCEFKLNHPVAAHAALKIAVHCKPGDEELVKGMKEVFGDKSRLPTSARRDYSFQSPPAGAGGTRRAAWDSALAKVGGGGAAPRLADAARAFEQLTSENADDAAAWYNLGLARAWLGDNHAAAEALNRYVALEGDDAKAAAAWALAEVLHCGQGMDDVTDYHEHSVLYQIRDPQAFSTLLDAWQKENRFVALQVSQEQGILTGLVLERTQALTPELAATQLAGLSAYLLILMDQLRLWNTNPEAIEQLRGEIKQRCGPALAGERTEQRVANFNDLLAETLAFPNRATDKDDAKKRVLEHTQRYFEETWVHRPRKALDGNAPLNAVDHPTLRKKLLGVVQFLQECGEPGNLPYDFDRLRRQLGLLSGAAPAAGAAPDIAGMSAADLGALAADALPAEQLEQAFQAALKLDARDLAGRFARALVARPAAADRPADRFPYYAHLVQLALAEGDTDSALGTLTDGEKADCEQNEGRRRNDYELRRGQIHARRGEADAAQDVFERLIQRVPAELRFRGSAAEAMLSARQSSRALHFAEPGLAKAREKNDRDSEHYFMELVDAARKMGT